MTPRSPRGWPVTRLRQLVVETADEVRPVESERCVTRGRPQPRGAKWGYFTPASNAAVSTTKSLLGRLETTSPLDKMGTRGLDVIDNEDNPASRSSTMIYVRRNATSIGPAHRFRMRASTAASLISGSFVPVSKVKW